MNPLGFVPMWVWVVVAALAYGQFRSCQARDAEAKVQGTVIAVANARAEALARDLKEQEKINDAQRRATLASERARDAAEVARLAAERSGSELQQRARDLAARACAPTAAAASGVGPAAHDAGGPAVLADVLGRLEEAGRRVASVADDRRIRGAECQAQYDALRGGGDDATRR